MRLENERIATLVVMGARIDGTKEVVAIEEGYRESKDSWLFFLQNLRDRRMKAPVIAVGHGGLGFWPALVEVFPETREQCGPGHGLQAIARRRKDMAKAQQPVGVRFINGVRVEQIETVVIGKPMITKAKNKKRNDYAKKAAACSGMNPQLLGYLTWSAAAFATGAAFDDDERPRLS